MKVAGKPRQAARLADPLRLDLLVGATIERQIELVLSGVHIAALHGQPDQWDQHDAVAPDAGGSDRNRSGHSRPPQTLDTECPPWLTDQVENLLLLIRLAAGAGVVLPHSLVGSSPTPMATASGHLSASRAHSRNTIEVLTRLGHAPEVNPVSRGEALRLLERVRGEADYLDEGHPGASTRPGLGRDDDWEAGRNVGSQRPSGAREGFLPGQLLG